MCIRVASLVSAVWAGLEASADLGGPFHVVQPDRDLVHVQDTDCLHAVGRFAEQLSEVVLHSAKK